MIQGMENYVIMPDRMNEKINPVILNKFFEKESEYLYDYQDIIKKMGKELTSTMD